MELSGIVFGIVFRIIFGSLLDHFGITLGSSWAQRRARCSLVVRPYTVNLSFGEEPFVALLETSTFGSPGGGKESMYRLYLVTTV